MIVIVDYGMGNLRSVQKGFEKVGHTATVTSDPDLIRSASKVVLPGVGAFGDAMQELRKRELVEPVKLAIAEGKPFLGICLGLQLLFDVSYEGGTYEGLGVLPGEVVRFELPHEYKVPHMGWNQLQIRRPAPILAGLAEGTHVYFVHSYYAVPRQSQDIAAETDYGRPFTSAVWRDNVFATQFHPEKSQADGLKILRNFAGCGGETG
jgi:glutamine amidotransferase